MEESINQLKTFLDNSNPYSVEEKTAKDYLIEWKDKLPKNAIPKGIL